MRVHCFFLCAQNIDEGTFKAVPLVATHVFQPLVETHVCNSRQVKSVPQYPSHDQHPLLPGLDFMLFQHSTALLPLPSQPICSPKVWGYTVGKGTWGHAEAPNTSLHIDTCSQSRSAKGCFPVVLLSHQVRVPWGLLCRCWVVWCEHSKSSPPLLHRAVRWWKPLLIMLLAAPVSSHRYSWLMASPGCLKPPVPNMFQRDLLSEWGGELVKCAAAGGMPSGDEAPCPSADIFLSFHV